MKTCSQCGNDKPLTQFGADSHAPDGKKYICKECVKINNAEFKLQNPEYQSDYYQQNKAEILRKAAERYEQNKQDILDKRRRKRENERFEEARYGRKTGG